MKDRNLNILMGIGLFILGGIGLATLAMSGAGRETVPAVDTGKAIPFVRSESIAVQTYDGGKGHFGVSEEVGKFVDPDNGVTCYYTALGSDEGTLSCVR